MIFLTETDFKVHLGQVTLTQIVDPADLADALDAAELKAIGIVKDLVGGRYNIDAETQVEGQPADRHQPLVLWLLSIASYQLYRQIPDEEVPERIIKDYDDTMATLKEIGRGKTPTNMASATDSDGEAIRVFRMKSNTPRGHNML